MTIEIIPSGSSAVVTDSSRDKWVETMEAIKDAECDAVRTTKDTEANLDRAAGDRFMQTVQDVKDAETRLHEDLGNKFLEVVQDVKDAETRLHKDAADKFITTVQDIKDADRRGSDRAGRMIDVTRQSAYETERSASQTREDMLENFRHTDEKFCSVKEVVQNKYEALAKEVGYGFKEAQKDAYQNQLAVMLQFKDAALLAEKLACSLKEHIGYDGQKTRDLINSQEVDRLRERAQRAETQLALLQINVGTTGATALAAVK